MIIQFCIMQVAHCRDILLLLKSNGFKGTAGFPNSLKKLIDVLNSLQTIMFGRDKANVGRDKEMLIMVVYIIA